jgi:hypothetical protein
LGEALEEKGLRSPDRVLHEGLCRIRPGDRLQLEPVADAQPIAQGKPVLVFLHGTFSSAAGSFGSLWDDAAQPQGQALRAALRQRYGEEIYAFEHRSLTQSPIENALALARHLRPGTELHLVSHSRGGLVGELLCLGQVTREGGGAATAEDLQQRFRPAPNVDNALGLLQLDTTDQAERAAAIDQDRDRLAELHQALQGVAVRRFARVACPARGTTLASGRLDRWLNLLSLVLPDGVASDLLDFLFAVVKHRTDPRTLPGLEAMMPGSALVQLLSAPDLVTDADLTAIVGDTESTGGGADVRFKLARRLAIRAADLLFPAEHDFVVDTDSMRGGLTRQPTRFRLRRDQGLRVDHFSYFRNDKSFLALRETLLAVDPNQPADRTARAVSAPPLRSVLASRGADDSRRPIAVLIPGTMGSELHADGEAVWIHAGRLARGQLDRIAMGAPKVEPFDLVTDFYGPLAQHLQRSHQVRLLPYDWRLSITAAAARLRDLLRELLPIAQRDKLPIHLVAHSMGGLVARTLIADACDGGGGAEVWQQVCQHPQSRLLMLGTPNRGSHEAVRWLVGCNPTQIKLSLLDLTRSTHGLIDLVKHYPGLLELLPNDVQPHDFADPATWQRLKAEARQTWTPADPARLRAARATWQKLEGQAVDPARMVYVAGCQPRTVCGFDVDVDPGRPEQPPQIAWRLSGEGDGTVLWASGRLPGVPTYYAPDTAHDELCSNADDARIFRGYVELLLNGRTDQLAQQPPGGDHRGIGEVAARPTLQRAGDAPVLDALPDPATLRSLGLGSASPRRRRSHARPPVSRIEVSLTHGNLAFARHPLLVGHYLGDTIVSAEKALDQRLGGELARRLALGLYPGALGTHAVFQNAAGRSPSQALVMGLGQVGELSPGHLEVGVRDLLLDLALRSLQPGMGATAGSPVRLRISSLLIGTGAGALKPREAMESILRGAIAANRKLQAAALDDRVLIDRIEFLELYEDIALGAAQALEDLLQGPDLQQDLVWSPRELVPGEGRRQRRRFDEDPGWWQRLEIATDPDTGQLRFAATTDRARAEESLGLGQLSLADRFVAQASASTVRDPEVARTLFEMLMPPGLKSRSPEQRDVVLMLDADSARFPWELLEDRWSPTGEPLAVAAGMVRQLRTRRYRTRPQHTVERTVCVIGDPDLADWAEVAQLPGARAEAGVVETLFRGRGFQPTACVQEQAPAILTALHGTPWRVLHLAGHGVHEYEVAVPEAVARRAAVSGRKVEPQRHSGMVIGRETFLTAGDIEQLRHVPELVFINCCHLGQTRVDGIGQDLNRLAANLGVQFIEMGVKAVVAAGWAVDDAAALVFARTFYERMLGGETFGVAVQAARAQTFRAHPGSNTWGAYQCYGDPSYRLSAESPASGPAERPRFYAPSELVAELDNLRESVRTSAREPGHTTEAADIERRIQDLISRAPAERWTTWQQRADVAAALGFAWGEIADFTRAIDWLKTALAAESGDCPVRVAEQLANFKARRAAKAWQVGRGQAQAQGDAQAAVAASRQARGEIDTALRELGFVCDAAETIERLNLLASACKRLAWVSDDDANGRREALINLQGYSRRAMDRHAAQHNRAINLYSFTNWALAGLMLDGSTAPAHAAWCPDLDARCEAGLAQSRADDAAAPKVWNLSAQGDMALIQLLHADPSDAPRIDDRRALATENYRRAFARASSERERQSVLESLAFLIELTGTGWPGSIVEALATLKESI